MCRPKRIQRKRTKGWKMPTNTVSVTRPGKWGNPFRLIGDMIYIHVPHRRGKYLSPWVVYYSKPVDQAGYTDHGFTAGDVVRLFRDILFDLTTHPEVEQPVKDKIRLMRDRIFDLRGKNLACFCKEGEPCHADALIELANS